MAIVGILLLIIHVVCCGGLILVVLLQAGKGASLGAAFGGGASQTMFGASGATMMGKLTWVMAGAFMLTSLLLTMIPVSGGKAAAPAPAIVQEETATPPLGTPSTAVLPEAGSAAGQETSGAVGGDLTPQVPPAPAEAETPAVPAPAEGATHSEPESHPSE